MNICELVKNLKQEMTEKTLTVYDLEIARMIEDFEIIVEKGSTIKTQKVLAIENLCNDSLDGVLITLSSYTQGLSLHDKWKNEIIGSIPDYYRFENSLELCMVCHFG